MEEAKTATMWKRITTRQEGDKLLVYIDGREEQILQLQGGFATGQKVICGTVWLPNCSIEFEEK